MSEDNQLINLIAGFTSGGTPLQATVGSKSEWMVTILTASMLANETLAASTRFVEGAGNETASTPLTTALFA